jgi:LysM repeat protein
MRTHSIAGMLPDQEFVAQSVDPTGWLARPNVAGHGANRVGDVPGADGSRGDVVMAGRDPASGRADDRLAVRTGEWAGRRNTRVRRGRHVSTNARRATRARQMSRTMSVRLPAIEDTAESASVGAASVLAASIHVAAAGSVADGYRLGRWARLALTVTVVLAVIVLTVTLAAGSSTSTLVDITVGPGDSLWSIAAAAAPDRDPRAVIDEMRQLNGLSGDVLYVGAVLRVPTTGEDRR